MYSKTSGTHLHFPLLPFHIGKKSCAVFIYVFIGADIGVSQGINLKCFYLFIERDVRSVLLTNAN